MKYLISSALFIFLLTIFIPAEACTDIRIIAQDGTILIGRTLEFALDLKSNVRNSTRNRSFSEIAPNGKAGLSWKAKYGYVYLDGINIDATVDGMNEAGLSFEYLYLPGFTQYQTVPEGKENLALPNMHLGDWILSNFKNIDEVKNAINGIYVYAQNFPQINNQSFPLHVSVFDASGRGIVIEFVNGKAQVSDNIGVMTNSPTYNWHVTNVRNYLNITPINPKPVIEQGITYASLGQGAGLLGLPGDPSPPSRFVKMSIMLATILPAKNAVEALNYAQHVLNNVDIPLGYVREIQSGNVTNESTEWTVYKDLTHKIFYYRTYSNTTLSMIDMNKINFAEGAPLFKMPIAAGQYILDMTPQFLTSK